MNSNLAVVRGGSIVWPAPLVLALSMAIAAAAQPFWPQFRGPNGSGVSESARPPIHFAKTNALWVTEVPGGYSSPSIWEDHVYLTSFSDGALECRAYSRADGRLLWSRPAEAKEIENTHPYSNPAAPTPASDAQGAIFYFGSYGLLAFAPDGKLSWKHALPVPVSRGSYGSASSPIIHGDLIIQAVDTDQGGSRLFAFKRSDGAKAWETPRPLVIAGWSTPVVCRPQGRPQIVLLGSKHLTAYDPAEGKELWSVAGFPLETVPSPAFDEEMVYACSAAVGGRGSASPPDSRWSDLAQFDQNKDGRIEATEVPASHRLVLRPELPEGHPGRHLPFPVADMIQGVDQDEDQAVTRQEWEAAFAKMSQMDRPVLMAIRPAAPGATATNTVAWEISRGIPEVPSPLCYRGRIYLVRDGGLLQCVDAKSGAVLYQERVGASGGYSASPVAAQGRVYLASQAGTIVVIDAQAPSLNVLARNSVDERINATPALVEDKIYIRTDKHLFAFGAR